MNGFESIEALRQMERMNGSPVVIAVPAGKRKAIRTVSGMLFQTLFSAYWPRQLFEKEFFHLYT
jgi:hypothetical protein